MLAGAALALAAGLALPGTAAADNVAIVVINSDYRDLTDLEHGSSGEIVAGALEAAGFRVERMRNATTGGMIAALLALGKEQDPDGAAVFYFSGYARQMRGRNFILAKNARPRRPFDFVTQGLDLDSVTNALAKAGGRLQLVVLDGAYPEPMLEGLPDLDPGLAVPAPKPTEAILLGARAGTILGDGEGAEAIAEAFAEALADPQEDLGLLTARFARSADVRLGRTIFVGLGADANRPLVVPAAAAPEPPAPQTPEPPETAEPQTPEPTGPVTTFVPAPTGTETPETAQPEAPAVPETAALSALEFDAQLSFSERQRIQLALRSLGLYQYGIDGVFGPGSRAAIRTFQRLRGFEATGYLDHAQREVLFDIAGL
ncbi:hypothetical protein LNKW23_08060 [Paralimibaculum aggregatum]|uniref:Caspase family p20 domain-containing protein n=1 Tax=Paralimibaculum aggregatum TaxID=3036245 RepID=A0ABQ6LL99_9RHOB|nr:peptidoglycan-binding protein [Limibaculum sp. NKW23]GMG81593.1 hypothetical protein LNKW23_08060 [Limibaculum sp. NKW23]